MSEGGNMKTALDFAHRFSIVSLAQVALTQVGLR
jgi:hypothetical protein